MKNFWHKSNNAYKVESKDKKFQINYTTHKDAVHALGKKDSKNVLKNAPGPQQAVKKCRHHWKHSPFSYQIRC